MHGAVQSVVLVAHEDLAVCIKLGKLLSASGHVILGPASSIEQTLRLLDHITPDAALLGWNLEGIPAVAVAQRLLDLELPFALISDVSRTDGELDFLQFVPRLSAAPDDAHFGDFVETLLRSHPPSIVAAIDAGTISKEPINLH